jgi:hypothetical protein
MMIPVQTNTTSTNTTKVTKKTITKTRARCIVRNKKN